MPEDFTEINRLLKLIGRENMRERQARGCGGCMAGLIGCLGTAFGIFLILVALALLLSGGASPSDSPASLEKVVDRP